MSKPKNTKTVAPKKAAKKPEQLKLKGTERKDAIPEIEAQARNYLEARNDWQEGQATMMHAQELLTDLLKKHGKTEYFFEDASGQRQRAYIPDVKGAKVQKVKPAKEASA